MKRIVTLICALLLVITIALPCNAASAKDAIVEEIIYLEDGTYLEITLESYSVTASGTITKNKHLVHRESDGSAMWEITLTGTFTYNGTTSSCTASNCSVTIYESNWYTVSKSATKSGNTAYATVTMGRTVLGVTVAKDTYNLTLTCDKNGNVS